MSIIVPSGKYGIKWVPSEKKLTKTAQADMGGAVEDVDVEDDSRDALYEAAKGVVEAMDAEQGKVVETDISVSDGEVGEEIDEEVEEVEEVEGAGDAVEEAVEKVEEAVEDLKVAVEGGDVTEIGDEEEVEIPVEEDNGELIVESVPGEIDSIPAEVDGCGPMAETKEEVVESEVEAEAEAGMDKSASANEFCKFGKLSPQNRKKVADYWKNALGYPADYVSLMVKDYEK
jgi:hypothetical protein